MKKQTYAIAIAVLVAGLVAAGIAFWLLSSGTPSYDKICRMNDDLKQARQLGLSSQEKCAERLGVAILKTTDETLLANLLANVSFEERFTSAIFGKIKNQEHIEFIARTLKPDLVSTPVGEDGLLQESLYDAVLNRLPDDAAVERVVSARLSDFGVEMGGMVGSRGSVTSAKSALFASLCRRICAMEDRERMEVLLEKVAEAGLLRELSADKRLEIALRTANPTIRQATGVAREYLELGDLVTKWDPDCLSLSVREILARGREIRSVQEYVSVVERFDPDFKSDDIDKWAEYGKNVKPLLDSLERLSTDSDSSASDSSRRSRLVEKRDKAKKDYEEYKKVIDEVRAAINKNDVVTVMAACEFVGVNFNGSDPEDTGWRLGNKLKERYQESKAEMEAAERELDSLDRAASSQKDQINREKVRLQEQLKQIRQRHETPEARKAREERETAEQKALEPFFSKNTDPDNISLFASRKPGQRGRALGKWGAGGGDSSVMRALRWLKLQQKSDGSWGDDSQFRTALTGMAVLTYLAHNETPDPYTEFGTTVARAIRFLCDSIGSDGFFSDKDDNNYSHPIGVCALGEAYAMTKNPLVKSAIERAVQPIIRGQNSANGWGDKMLPTATTDASYSGWCVQAIKTIYDAGIDTPGIGPCYEKSKHTFDFVFQGSNDHPDEIAIATFCMQLLEQYADPKVKSAMRYMDSCTYDFEHWENQPWGSSGPSPVYYWYYMTQAKFQEGGATFGAWNKMFLPELQKRQQIIKGESGASDYQDLTGKYHDIGWWDGPSRGETFLSNRGDLPCTWYHRGVETQGLTSLDCRIMDTCLCSLQLMVYYRFPRIADIE